MKKLKFIIVAVLIGLWGCSKENTQNEELSENSDTTIEPLTGEEINTYIKESLNNTGDFSWSDVSDYILWSATMNGDSILTVGYTKSSVSGNSTKSKSENSLKEKIIEVAYDIENCNQLKSSSENLSLYENESLCYVDLKIQCLETISALRSMDSIRYIEPSGYNFFDYEDQLKSSSGCGTEGETINEEDYSSFTPDCLVPWTFYKHNITEAWDYSTGSNITVGLIDTGVSEYQSLFNTNFNNGYSTDRTILKYGTYDETVYDQCGHGTCMAGNLAAPRNNMGMPVGVAYNCNLITYRGTSDVLLNSNDEQNGVAEALTDLADNADVDIISMSLGYIFTISKIEDAIEYAYDNGKLIFAAGGTSTSYTTWWGVIFPANMDETVAVTGITDSGEYEACSTCHSGSEIDFTVIMQREDDADRKSVCAGYYENTMNYIGGSSVATSFTAGIAALVWSNHPSWTKDEVLSKLKESAEFYPDKDDEFGYGNIDAYLAVQ